MRLRLFGRVGLLRGDGATVELETRKVALVLAVLGLRPGKPYGRQTLADAVWPESDPDAARASLRVALSSLRKALGTDSGAIVTDRIECSLDPESATSDTGEFFAAIRGARVGGGTSVEHLERALGLYSSKPLEGLDGPWVDWARGLLRKRADEARELLLEALMQAGKTEKAAQAGLEAMERQPGSEKIARYAISALVGLGRAAEATEAFERLRDHLWKRHGVAPAADIARILPSKTAAPPPMTERAHLPVALGRMVGRDSELQRLLDVLSPGSAQDRLVTVFGAGGLGKTRMLIEVAQALSPRYQGRVAWVDLTSIRDANQIVPNALSAMGLRPIAGQLSRIEADLGSPPYLVVLDNLEQFGAEAQAPIESLLAAHRSLRVLASSRHKIEIEGERVFPLEPLATMGPEARTIPAVELFMDLAERNRPGIQWSDEVLESVTGLVQALEGLPLAIRLAANRADVLSASEIRQQVSDRFALLREQDNSQPERHRSLWASIEWTYKLLPSAKLFFAQVAQFPAPFTLDHCRAVTDEPAALEMAQVLVRRSLLSLEDTPTGSRYRMLESVREFGDRVLEAEDRSRLVRRYVEHYATWCDARADELYTDGADNAMRLLAAEEPNFRQAFEWALEDVPRLGLSIAYSVATYFDGCGRYWDAIAWLDRAEEKAGGDVDPELLAGVASDRAQCYVRLRRPKEAVAALERQIGLMDKVPPRTKFNFFTSLGSASLMAGESHQALAHFRAASEFAREVNLVEVYAPAASNEALAHLMLGELDASEAKANEAKELAERSARRASLGSSLYTLAHVALCRGDVPRAMERCKESVRVLEEGGLNAALSGRLTFLSELHCAVGRFEEAIEYLTRSVDRLVRAGMDRDLADCARAAGSFCHATGAQRQAVEFLSFYERYLDGSFVGRSLADTRKTVPELLAELRRALGKAAFDGAALAGRAWDLRDIPEKVAALTLPEPKRLQA